MLVQKSERIKDKHNVNDIVYNVFINSFLDVSKYIICVTITNID